MPRQRARSIRSPSAFRAPVQMQEESADAPTPTDLSSPWRTEVPAFA